MITKKTSIKKDSKKKNMIFVVQQHAATSMHYDFRIEYRGKLMSWAVPKGPSTDPSKKQLAMKVGDHPLSYASFEGVIPQGHYGAGPVIVWDTGTFENQKKNAISTCEKQGEIIIWLEGEKLKGGYALVKAPLNAKNSWLLIKMKDEYANPALIITEQFPKSVISGKTIDELKS